MKIYHKSNFAIGLLLLGLGFANLFFAWQEGHTSLGHTWHIIFFCFLLGGGIVIRSLSYQMTYEDNITQRDERTLFIALKSHSKSLSLTQSLCLVLMLFFCLAAKTTGEEGFIGIAVGMAFAYSISMFAEIFSTIYYDKRC